MKAAISEEEKFKFSDLYSFNIQYWLLTISCAVTYMSIFTFIQNASDMLQTKYHFDKITAGLLFGVPYIISAIASPFLGFLVDKIGKRAFMMCVASSILTMAFLISLMMPECDKCYMPVYPLVITGFGYSVYAACIWSTIPYVVAPSTVGTAFGITTAIQNIGLVMAPTLVGTIKDKTKMIDHGFFWVQIFFIGLNIIGLSCNMYLYYIDIYYNGGVLDKVDQGTKAEKEASEEKALLKRASENGSDETESMLSEDRS